MRHPLTLAATIALTAPALAQAQTVGTVQDISVVGTTDLLSNYLKAALSVQPGDALSSVKLRQVEQEVLATGYFKSAVADLRTVSGKDVLNITVVSNPTIQTVETSGFSFLPGDQFKARVAELLNIAPGAVLNTQRLDQAKQALTQNYQQQGFPFTPSISVSTKTNADGTAAVTFVVDETAPIRRIEIEGATLLPSSTVNAIFKPLYDAKKFNTQTFFAASDQLQQAYSDAGYLQAGINTGDVTLSGGVLKIKVTEGKVAVINTDDLGTLSAVPTLQSKVGQPVTLALLREDVRTLSNATGKAVGFALQPDPQNPGQVAVYFGTADIATGPIKSVVFKGNTRVPTATLQAALKTKPGDVYSPQLAQDDFMAVREAYRKAGYEISTRDALSFQDGVLTFNIREVTLVGYELDWQGTHRTKDRVILRELPTTGKLFNVTELQAALGNISRLGFVTITGANVASKDPQNPENVTYVLQLSEGKSGVPIGLALGYDSLAGGWSGSGNYENNNVLGLGQTFRVEGGAQQNQAGQNLVGSASYIIPWLDLNFGDFRQKRTSLTFGVGSTVAGNSTLYDPSVTTTDGKRFDTGRQYTTRTTGISASLGRNLTPNLQASLGTSFNYKTYYLEGIQSGETSTYSDDAATKLLSPENLTTRLSGSLNYDTTDSPSFPGRGVRASTTLGYNFGRSGDTPLSWTDGELGASTYFGFGGKRAGQFGQDTYKNAFAVRANYGTVTGTYPDGTLYSVGGSSQASSRELRGLGDAQLSGTSYLTSSAELRHDFGVSNSVLQGVYGVAFADYGGVWNSGNFTGTYGVGAGVQVDLGLGGARLPSLRFDYGFSPLNTTQTGGRFMFRIGNFW